MFSTPPPEPPETIKAMRMQSTKSAPPSHQVAFSTKSAERVAPNIWLAEPPIDASMPPPFGFWIKIEPIKSALTRVIRTIRRFETMIFFLKKDAFRAGLGGSPTQFFDFGGKSRTFIRKNKHQFTVHRNRFFLIALSGV